MEDSASPPNATAVELQPINQSIKIEDIVEVPVAPAVPNPKSSNPKEWPRSKKYTAVAFASMYTFISPMSSSMVAPALPFIYTDLGFTSTFELEMALSIFILAYVVGPLILGPLSEVYGRRIILQGSLLLFVVFNAACGVAQNAPQMLAFRFLAGLGGSSPIALGGSVVADCFNGEEMGGAMSYYVLGVILSPALGPIIGGFATQGLTWHWIFYIVSIIGGIMLLFGTFLLPETYAPILQAQEKKRNGDLSGPEKTLMEVLPPAIGRPLIMLFTQPIVMIIALIMAFVYGSIYIVLSTFSLLFVTHYGETTQISSLHYLGLALGFFFGNRLAGSLIDTVSSILQKRYNTPHKPEYRLPVCIPAAFCLPIGVLIYGWGAENNVHWIVLDLGAAIFAMSVNITFQALTVYTVDVYTLYSASALAAVGTFRSLAGFGFPLFAPQLYEQFGYGWGNTLLAGLGVVIGIPAPVLLYVYGERIRAYSKFGSG